MFAVWARQQGRTHNGLAGVTRRLRGRRRRGFGDLDWWDTYAGSDDYSDYASGGNLDPSYYSDWGNLPGGDVNTWGNLLYPSDSGSVVDLPDNSRPQIYQPVDLASDITPEPHTDQWYVNDQGYWQRQVYDPYSGGYQDVVSIDTREPAWIPTRSGGGNLGDWLPVSVGDDGLPATDLPADSGGGAQVPACENWVEKRRADGTIFYECVEAPQRTAQACPAGQYPAGTKDGVVCMTKPQAANHKPSQGNKTPSGNTALPKATGGAGADRANGKPPANNQGGALPLLLGAALLLAAVSKRKH